MQILPLRYSHFYQLCNGNPQSWNAHPLPCQLELFMIFLTKKKTQSTVIQCIPKRMIQLTWSYNKLKYMKKLPHGQDKQRGRIKHNSSEPCWLSFVKIFMGPWIDFFFTNAYLWARVVHVRFFFTFECCIKFDNAYTIQSWWHETHTLS